MYTVHCTLDRFTKTPFLELGQFFALLPYLPYMWHFAAPRRVLLSHTQLPTWGVEMRFFPYDPTFGVRQQNTFMKKRTILFAEKDLSFVAFVLLPMPASLEYVEDSSKNRRISPHRELLRLANVVFCSILRFYSLYFFVRCSAFFWFCSFLIRGGG